MKSIRNLLIALTIVLTLTGIVAAQSEAELKKYFEGKWVKVKIDMPGDAGGIEIRTAKAEKIDAKRTAQMLRDYGTAINDGQEARVTKIKVKGKQIEFQLDGGGFDEYTGDPYVAPIEKSDVERKLEMWLKDEKDPTSRRNMEENLAKERRQREEQNKDNREKAKIRGDELREIAKQKRLEQGSRFNIYFKQKINPAEITPEVVKTVLSEYVDFNGI